MKAVTLLYHDAVEGKDYAASGFLSQGANIYKLDIAEMERHFEAIAAARTDKPASVRDQPGDIRQGRTPLFLTFDDGGVSAATHIAALLERFGWTGHFLITGAYIDTPTFVSTEQIRELAARGHVVGSHSWSHPGRMSKCSYDELQQEWGRSVARLSDILGEQVTVASVPGGYFSRNVARAASACGIRVLFTSEPVKNAYYVDQCLVLGRYTLVRDMPPGVSGALCSDAPSFQQARQYLLWNTKKLVKAVGGSHYATVRERLLGRRDAA